MAKRACKWGRRAGGRCPSKPTSKRRRVPRSHRGFRGPRFCTLETNFHESKDGCVQATSTYVDRKTKRKKPWSCWWCPDNESAMRPACEQTMLSTERGCPKFLVTRTKET